MSIQTESNFQYSQENTGEKGDSKKVLKFKKVYWKTHRRSGLLISEFAL